MAVIVSPVGLAAAPVANVANIMATYKEKLILIMKALKKRLKG